MLLTQIAPIDSDSEISPKVLSHIERAFFGGEEVDKNQVIHAAFLHHFKALGGGTRMQLTYHCSSLLGIDFESSCSLAACVESLHNASLIQDDLQDRSSLRRGRPTVAVTFGNDVALGLTNRLITSALVCLTGKSMAPALAALIQKVHQVVAETIDGQTIEMLGGNQMSHFDSRLNSSAKKSGPLFSLALGLPLIMSGNQSALDLAHQAAMQFGLGYQIIDDLDDHEKDAALKCDGNLILAMNAQSIDDEQDSVSQAIQLARGLFHDAAEKAERLPHKAGSPLIDLINRYLPLLDARSH
jgi:geranylgeranyl pyrophosphate synthase